VKSIEGRHPYPLYMSDVEAQKEAAGIAACEVVKTGMNVGLGTGSTVKYTVIELGRRIAEEGLEIIGVPTSIATEKLALEVGIPLADLGDLQGLDVVIDGTDEFDGDFQLIKGGGGALLREKIVAQASASMIVVADGRKKVNTLGEFPLPIEITPFSWVETKRQLSILFATEGFIGDITLRRKKELGTVSCDGVEFPANEKGGVFVTDNGNVILDCHFGASIVDPIGLETAILSKAGVAQVGLFNNMCDAVYLADPAGVQILRKN
jgi:ribose 5-phosphate isomerase A